MRATPLREWFEFLAEIGLASTRHDMVLLSTVDRLSLHLGLVC